MASTSYRTGSLLRSALSSSRVSSSSSSAARRASAVPSSTRSFSLLPRIGSPSRATPLTSSSRMAPTSALSRRTLFVQTQTTPNPNSLQFIPGTPVLSSGGTHEFLTPASSLASPLATRLMDIQGVVSVFYGPDFVSVQKDDDTPWSLIKPEVFSHIMEHFSSGAPLFRSGSKEAEEADNEPEDTRILDTDSEVVAMIKDLLATRIRPSIMEDGGDLEYKGFSDEEEGGNGMVTVKLKGSCRGCSSSAITLKSGIERMLMHYVPEVKGVEQVVDEDEALALDEFTKFEAKLAAKQAAAAPATDA